ncbi:hypothetical protein ACFRAQ_05585 [Nocardia sp. NPDC056611]|uniref:hypothetical protein n=1 Tax=Nocardia sp. NPDC056611 TaxID=3345877 RepID=UPI00366D0DD5
MSVDDILPLLDEDRPVGWVQYRDGSWAPVTSDGWVGPPITAVELLQATHRDLAALEAAGLIATVVDTEPLSVVDIDYSPRGGLGTRAALKCGPTDHPQWRNQLE